MKRLRLRSKSFNETTQDHDARVATVLDNIRQSPERQLDSLRVSPIVAAAAMGDADTVREACTTSIRTAEWTAALYGAATIGHLKIVRIILEQLGKSCNENAVDYSLALRAARVNRHPHVVDLLLRTSLGLAPENEAIEAAARGDVSLVMALLSPRIHRRLDDDDDDDDDAPSTTTAKSLPTTLRRSVSSTTRSRSLRMSPIRPVGEMRVVTSELLKNMHAAAVVNNKPEVVYAILRTPRARSVIDIHRARKLAEEKGYVTIIDAIDSAMKLSVRSGSPTPRLTQSASSSLSTTPKRV